jgi:NADPH:quinone reductase-like Zn-dependent oxidoreductase
MAALVALIRPGGVIVTTATTAQEDSAHDEGALSLFGRSDADQLAALVAKVDACELRVDVSGRYPLSDLAEVQDQGAAGKVRGKVLVTPAA